MSQGTWAPPGAGQGQERVHPKGLEEKHSAAEPRLEPLRITPRGVKVRDETGGLSAPWGFQLH